MYIGGRDKLVRALDARTGKAGWTFTARARVDSSPVIAGSRLYVGSSDNRLYVLDLATGQKHWEFDAGAPVTASPAIAAGRLVIGPERGIDSTASITDTRRQGCGSGIHCEIHRL
jgi:outer membrane protein assembly factor BamB